jgi:CBS domain containing-hemolysin-like protein
VMAAFDHVPEPGEAIHLDGLRLEIEAVEGGAPATVIVGNRPNQNDSADS